MTAKERQRIIAADKHIEEPLALLRQAYKRNKSPDARRFYVEVARKLRAHQRGLRSMLPAQ